MKRILLTFLFIFPLLSNAQGEATWWFFGENASLDFSTGAPVTGPVGSLFTTEGCSAISDECGVLLFYSDGSDIWDRNGNIMPNGTGLSGNSSSAQSAIIIPDLQVSNVYFVITKDDQSGPLDYSIVDISLNGGLGDVVPGRKNIPIRGNAQEKVTATLNANGDRYWIVTFDNGIYHSYLAGGGLVVTNPGSVVSTPIAGSGVLNDNRGYLRLSPDGSKIMNTSVTDPMILCDFDNNTGIVSNPLFLTNPNSTSDEFYGAEFSPNSQLVYINANSSNGGNSSISNNIKQLLQFNTQGAPGWQDAPVILSTETGEGRGALQLGIDGRLYHARTFTQNLGVVRNPNVVGMGAAYVHAGVTLPGTMRCREGLPPFITSFFEPTFLALDANMGSGGGNNNPETDFCDGTSIQFDSSGNALCSMATVLWDFGDNTSSTLFNPVHVFPGPGDYTVSLTVTSGAFSNTAVDIITIFETPVANPVNDVFLCDSNMDGSEDYDLTINETSQIIGTQTNPDFVVDYFLNQNNANNNVGAISFPQTFNVGTTTIVARITNNLNTASMECFDTVSFDVIVTSGTGATMPTDIVVCDDNNDGFFTHDLTSVENQIGLPLTQFTITYHNSQTDAQNGSNPILNPASYTNLTANTTETIYLRAEDINPSGCDSITQFDISVFDTPIANPILDSALCDIGNDNTEDIDLMAFDSAVLLTQTNANFEVTYHTNLNDAMSGNAPLVTTSPYTITGTTTFFVRIDNSLNEQCSNTTSFTITLDIAPVANTVTEFRLCDDPSNNGAESFDLPSKNPEVLDMQDPALFNIMYYVSQADAMAGTTPLADNYSSAGQTIYARIENINNPECFDITSLELIVDDLPVAGTPTTLDLCDISNDSVENVTLSQFDNEILLQSQPTFVLTYHETQQDAADDVNPLPAVYQVGLGTTTVFARIDNSDNETCESIISFDIILNEQAVANPVTEFRLCDDTTNGGIANDGFAIFDLSTKNPEVLDSQDPANFNIEYFTSQADANSGSLNNATPLPTLYNSGNDMIFVRIETIANPNCFETTSFDIFVDELPIAGTPANVIVCDDMSNGIGTESVDLSQFDTEINITGNPDFVVSYHSSQADANNDANPLMSPFTVSSTTPNLFARIDNVNDTDNICFDTTTFQFVISLTPVANTVQDMIECDGMDNDGSVVFDLSTADSQVLGSQNASDFTITYHNSQADADNNDSPLPLSYASDPNTNPEMIYVRIENSTNPQCADFTDFTLTVSEQPTAGVAMDQRGCDDNSNDGFEEFDFTNVDTEINITNNPDFTVTYHTSQADADSGDNAISFPFTNTSRTQTIHARIENNANTECYDTSSFVIEVFARPVIANQGPITICAGIDEVLDAGPGFTSYLWSTGETTQTITVNQGDDYDVTVFNSDGCDSTATITVIESDVAVIERVDVEQFRVNTNEITAIVTGSGDYEFSLDDFVYQDSPRFGNLFPGPYTIFVRDKNGCGTVSIDTFVIGAPAYFTPNNDGFHDTWNIIDGGAHPNANVYIFDRYGKLLKQIDASGAGWDGMFNSNPLPSSDYWFNVELEDGRSFKGHFALKR